MEAGPTDFLNSPLAYPERLLEDHVAIASRRSGALLATAARTRSLAARRLLAHAATGGGTSLEELIAQLRAGGSIHRHSFAKPSALMELAQVVSTQDIVDTDRADALAIADLAFEVLGPGSIAIRHQSFHTQLTLHQGDRERVKELRSRYGGIPEVIDTAIELDLTNPFAGTEQLDQRHWLKTLSTLLPPGKLEIDDSEDGTGFDRLRGRSLGAPTDDELVTAIITAYRPGTELLTAVSSLCAQGWSNLQILVVDDGSPDEFKTVLDRCNGLDERVEIMRLNENRGTYAARNAGMDAASGQFVTFLDSDDWAHPVRIEQQVEPLQSDRMIVAVQSDMLNVSESLHLTQPGRPPRVPNASSMMLRKGAVTKRIGYFDTVRKAADNEYLNRITLAFGPRATVQQKRHVHVLRRLEPGSLSFAELRGKWAHPARQAYWSAYNAWHEEIRTGKVSPYLERDLVERPFPAPQQFSSLRDRRRPPIHHYDVVLASDWRPFDGPQKSMIEELKALTSRGLQVGILHMEAFRLMSPTHQPLCLPIQRFINAGIVDQILETEEHVVELLVIRYPPVLQFPPQEKSKLMVKRAIVLANGSPSDANGTDVRYLPETCTATVEHRFSIHPIWAPQGPQVRAALERHGMAAANLTASEFPGVLDPDEWVTSRTGFRSERPVLGRHSRDDPSKWPHNRRTLLNAYPGTEDFDVRILGGLKSAKATLGGHPVPSNWLGYPYGETDVKSFLFQIDFWVYFPHPVWCEAFGRAVLEALAAGCVVILPHRFHSTFGDAALYRHPGEVRETVMGIYGDLGRFLALSRNAQTQVRQWFSHEAYLRQISEYLPCSLPQSEKT